MRFLLLVAIMLGGCEGHPACEVREIQTLTGVVISSSRGVTPSSYYAPGYVNVQGHPWGEPVTLHVYRVLPVEACGAVTLER